MFEGIEKAQSTQKLPHIKPGKYVFEVLALKWIPNSRKGALSVGEFKVIEAIGEESNEVGTSCSHVIKMSLDSALGNVKSLVAAISGKAEADVTAKDAQDAFATTNPAAGVRVNVEAFVTKTKAGTDFTLVTYQPYSTSATPAPVAGATSTTAAPKAGKAK